MRTTHLILILTSLLLVGVLANSWLLNHAVAQTGSRTRVFMPVADAYIDQSSAASNYGHTATLQINQSPTMRAYLRFNVSGVSGQVISATLLLHVNTQSTIGFNLAGLTDPSWSESSLTYNNAPAPGSAIQSSGPFELGTWTSMDVSRYVTGNGIWDFVVIARDDAQISLSGRESSNVPQLVIATGG